MRTYTHVKMELVEASNKLARMDFDASTWRAVHEHHIINAVGGVKQLGPNEAEQKRQLLVALDQDTIYKDMIDKYFALRETVALLEAELDCIVFAERQRETMIRGQAVARGVSL